MCGIGILTTTKPSKTLFNRVLCMGGNLAPSLGGTDQIFEWPSFRKKMAILPPKMFDEFVLSFICLYCLRFWFITFIKPFSWPKPSISQHLFLVSSWFVSHLITVLLKILGGDECMGRPTSNLGGPSPSPPKSPPMVLWISNDCLTSSLLIICSL